MSDFLSGFVHWAGDTVGDESTPVFGPNFVRPFRYHHVDPEDITRHDFIETNGNNCIVAAPVLLGMVLVLLPASDRRCCFYTCVVIACTALFVFCTNQFHKWAHTKNPAGWVRAAAAGRADPVARAPRRSTTPRRSDKYYCITVGWMNPLLEQHPLLPRRARRAITRIYPRALRPAPGTTALRRPRTPRSRCRADRASRRPSPAARRAGSACGSG